MLLFFLYINNKVKNLLLDFTHIFIYYPIQHKERHEASTITRYFTLILQP